jgi:hypothetical protein
MAAPAVPRLPFPQLSARDHGDVSMVSLSGELDFLAVPALLECLRATRARILAGGPGAARGPVQPALRAVLRGQVRPGG